MRYYFFSSPIFLSLISFIFLLQCSCQENSQNNFSDATHFYFSLKTFFNQEADLLHNKNTKVNKTVSHNLNQEQQLIQIQDWKKEFSVFEQADINKSAFVGKYAIDSATKNSDTTFITYQALDDALKIRHIELHFYKNEKNPFYLKINALSNNILYKTHQELEYQKGMHYSIKAFQEVKFYGKDSIIIYAQFI